MRKFTPKYLLLHLILFYRFFISPFLPASCRFYPTCSSFALEAIFKFGFFLGGWLAIKRLFRCHPFSRHAGVDLIP